MTDHPFIPRAFTDALARKFDETLFIDGLIGAEPEPVGYFPPIKYATNTIAISHEMAVDFGLIEPTPREQLERDESARKWSERRAKARPPTVAYLAAIDGITDQPSRAVLDLHSRGTGNYPECAGCDFSGYEGEPPEWPCRTVETIAAHHDIAAPDLFVFEETK